MEPDIIAAGTIDAQNTVPAGVAPAGSALELKVLGRNTIGVQVTGAYAVSALTLQGTIDGVNWVTIGGVATFANMNTGAAAATIAAAAVGIFQASVGAYKKIRITALGAITGAAVVTIIASDHSDYVGIDMPLPAGAAAIGSVSVTSASPGTGATNLGKAEDAAHTSADVGVMLLGVRAPATPVAPTSAQGDYGYLLLDQEGKKIGMPFADVPNQWQSAVVTLTTTASTAIKAAAAAGIRNYLTDIVIANTSATGTRVDVLDGATVIASYWSPPTSSLIHSLTLPKKGTAATALNVQLGTAVTDVRVSANGFLGI